MLFSELIRTLRKERHLSQGALAEALLVSRRSVSAWEKGEKLPNFDSIIALAVYFDVTTDYLLGLTREPQ